MRCWGRLGGDLVGIRGRSRGLAVAVAPQFNCGGRPDLFRAARHCSPCSRAPLQPPAYPPPGHADRGDIVLLPARPFPIPGPLSTDLTPIRDRGCLLAMNIDHIRKTASSADLTRCGHQMMALGDGPSEGPAAASIRVPRSRFGLVWDHARAVANRADQSPVSVVAADRSSLSEAGGRRFQTATRSAPWLRSDGGGRARAATASGRPAPRWWRHP